MAMEVKNQSSSRTNIIILEEWSNELSLEFLQLYESEPAIWNPKHPFYNSRVDVEQAWSRVQKKLSVQYPVKYLKKKRDSIMATFRPLYRKYVERLRYDVNATKPRWFAYDAIEKFMHPIYQQRAERKEGGVQHFYIEEISVNIDDDQQENNSSDNWTLQSVPSSTPAQTEPEIQEVRQESRASSVADHEDDSHGGEGNSNADPLSTAPGMVTSSRSILKSSRSILKSSRYKPKKRKIIEVESDTEKRATTSKTTSVISDTDNRATNTNTTPVVSSIFRVADPQDSALCSLYGELLAKKLQAFDVTTREIVMNQIDNLVFQARMKQLGVVASSRGSQTTAERSESSEIDGTQRSDPTV